jgi:hypothetical protein
MLSTTNRVGTMINAFSLSDHHTRLHCRRAPPGLVFVAGESFAI